jgi:NAD(P)-dependent dehydrogenase (short-subunit alcohol dehydrogenase family)
VVEETTDDELRSLFQLHFFAPVALTRAVLPHMRAQGGAAIVQMLSVGGHITAPGFGAYLRLVLGGDAIGNIHACCDQLTEVGRWEEVGRRTAIDVA